MDQKDHHLMVIKREQQKSLSQKREENRQKQYEKRHNVDKILKQQEKDRSRTLENIEQRTRCITALQKEKADLLEKRKLIKQMADIKKQQIIERIEEMKVKNKINFKTLSKLGIPVPDKEKIRENLLARTTKSTFSRTENAGSTSMSQKNIKQSSFSTHQPSANGTMKAKRRSIDDVTNSSHNNIKGSSMHGSNDGSPKQSTELPKIYSGVPKKDTNSKPKMFKDNNSNGGGSGSNKGKNMSSNSSTITKPKFGGNSKSKQSLSVYDPQPSPYKPKSKPVNARNAHNTSQDSRPAAKQASTTKNSHAKSMIVLKSESKQKESSPQNKMSKEMPWVIQ